VPARSAIAVAVAVLLGLGGCGGDGDPAPDRTTTASSAAPTGTAPGRAVAPATTGATVAPATTGATDATVPRPPRGFAATCPTKTTSPMGCRAVVGRVLAIQSYDPDGDGDLHVVAVGGDVTTPGITVFDVRPSLRPERDPVKGEYVTGAGPVFRGSLGQRQIQVDAFEVWRP